MNYLRCEGLSEKCKGCQFYREGDTKCMETEKSTVVWAKKNFPYLYFVSDLHVKAFILMVKVSQVYNDVEYLAAFYVMSALWNKSPHQYVKPGNTRIDIKKLHDDMGVMSSGKQAMVQLALNLFNPCHNADVFATFTKLDGDNQRVGLCAIAFRFSLFHPIE